MPDTSILSKNEKREIKLKLTEYANLGGDSDLTEFTFEDNFDGGDVGIKFFPQPEQAPVESIFFEIEIRADWDGGNLSRIGPQNLRNGGRLHETLESELTSIVKDAISANPEFVRSKGGVVFSCECGL